MMRLASLLVCAIPLLAACGSEAVTVGSQSSALTKKKDGSPTGDGTSCSWSDTAAYDAVSSNGTTTSSNVRTYALGDQFKSLDACNDCSCTAKGIMCTLRACGGGADPNPGQGVACPDIARQCPDGSYVGATGPNCEFVCPTEPRACTEEARQCPDGKTWVSRTGPNCEFAACP